MLIKVYQGTLIAAAIYILACDIRAAISDRPGAAAPELETVAISRGLVLPE
jgi:hypothetical protein